MQNHYSSLSDVLVYRQGRPAEQLPHVLNASLLTTFGVVVYKTYLWPVALISVSTTSMIYHNLKTLLMLGRCNDDESE